jgi:predicted AlkP superfamily pyrophosphatase or phosphodiesterase
MKRIATVTLTILLLGTSADTRGGETAAGDPSLVLIICIDQARYDYLQRFRPALGGGLETILGKGVVFSNAHHNHAITATSAGHASLATGLYPSHSGIVANNWFDRASGSEVYSAEDPEFPVLHPQPGGAPAIPGRSSEGRSPRNMMGTALGDWLKEANPKAKVFALGGKDRAAVLSGGMSADAAYWYDSRSGQFVTSRYYMKDYPAYMKQFHERKLVNAYFGRAWEPLPVEPGVKDKVGIVSLDQGSYHRSLPYPLGGASMQPGSGFYSAFYASPYMDEYVVDLAGSIIEAESLGSDADTDLLALCFSALDTVGHEYGPHSPEVLDVILRLDRALGELFEELDRRIGMSNVAIVLSADHGVMPLPEYLRSRQQEARRFTTEDVVCFQGIEKKLDERLGAEDWLLEDLYLDYEALGRKNLRRQEVEDELARLIGECPPVEKVWTRTQLESESTSQDPYLLKHRHSFHPDRSPDLFIQLKPFHLGRLRGGTTHGSAHSYDTHVPLIVVYPGLTPKVLDERVNTVDLAPTLAALLKIDTPKNLDGIDRSGWMN